MDKIEAEDIVGIEFSIITTVSLLLFILSLIFTSGRFRIFISPQLLTLCFVSIGLGTAKGWNKTIQENGKIDYEPLKNTMYSGVFIIPLQALSLMILVSEIASLGLYISAISSVGLAISISIFYLFLLFRISGLSYDDIILEKDPYKENKSIAFTKEEYDKYVQEITEKAQSSS